MLLPYINSNQTECGTDEAGRGCLAGPVTAAAVILPKDYYSNLLNDSKKLSIKKRELLRKDIENNAITYSVTHVDTLEILEHNILGAAILAMHRSIEKLKLKPDHIAVDGNYFKPYLDIPHSCVIKGDGKYLHIAAASILAKTYRDELMFDLHQKHPLYDWDKNKGYPTKKHREYIEKHGISKHHRTGFKLL